MSAIANIFKIPELTRRLGWTLALLAVYRVGIYVTPPGVNRAAMREIVSSGSGSFLGMFNMFSGRALEQFSIFALGIMPYVTASIVIQLLSVILPPLMELRKEGEAGQRKINQYTRYGAVIVSTVQAIYLARYVESYNGQSTSGDVTTLHGWPFYLLTVIALTTGTAFIMWLGEQITERGIGNGTSLIIFAGIVAGLPHALMQTGEQVKIGGIQPVSLLIVSVLILAVISVIVFVELGQRRIPVHYAKRMVGRKMYGGQTSHLPLPVNSAGVISPIFASSLLMFPGTLAGMKIPFMDRVTAALQPGDWRYLVIYVLLIIFFTYFYTTLTFQSVDMADNLKKQNAFIPSVRPGRATAEYLDFVRSRVTFGGAIYLAIVCLVPTILQAQFHVPFYFGGTSIIIIVGTALDTVRQIEAHLITRHYEGLTGPRGPRIRGRRS
ncbi:MAG: preprotein translocase subunit SecY [Sandaracinaceae bacterium]|nr:preprotein translocase subunit SecY [Sandaracinaceae bacterium]